MTNLDLLPLPEKDVQDLSWRIQALASRVLAVLPPSTAAAAATIALIETRSTEIPSSTTHNGPAIANAATPLGKPVPTTSNVVDLCDSSDSEPEPMISLHIRASSPPRPTTPANPRPRSSGVQLSLDSDDDDDAMDEDPVAPVTAQVVPVKPTPAFAPSRNSLTAASSASKVSKSAPQSATVTAVMGPDLVLAPRPPSFVPPPRFFAALRPPSFATPSPANGPAWSARTTPESIRPPFVPVHRVSPSSVHSPPRVPVIRRRSTASRPVHVSARTTKTPRRPVSPWSPRTSLDPSSAPSSASAAREDDDEEDQMWVSDPEPVPETDVQPVVERPVSPPTPSPVPTVPRIRLASVRRRVVLSDSDDSGMESPTKPGRASVTRARLSQPSAGAARRARISQPATLADDGDCDSLSGFPVTPTRPSPRNAPMPDRAPRTPRTGNVFQRRLTEALRRRQELEEDLEPSGDEDQDEGVGDEEHHGEEHHGDHDSDGDSLHDFIVRDSDASDEVEREPMSEDGSDGGIATRPRNRTRTAPAVFLSSDEEDEDDSGAHRRNKDDGTSHPLVTPRTPFDMTDLEDELRRTPATPIRPPPPKTGKRDASHMTPATVVRTRVNPNAPTTPAVRRHFAKHRDQLARAAYAEFNAQAFGGRLPENLPIVWSSRLNTTAGRAWLSSVLVGQPVAPVAKAGGAVPQGVAHSDGKVYLGWIELSTKVLDSELRMRSTLLHETCHVAAWLLDQTRKPPHGATFQKWGDRATRAFPALPVTRCHLFEIHFKYTYVCIQCNEVAAKRHSKSLDTTKYRCGHCRGALEIRTTNGTVAKSRAPSAYQVFVKATMPVVRAELASVGGPPPMHGEVMAEVAARWAVEKARVQGEDGVGAAGRGKGTSSPALGSGEVALELEMDEDE
ncbi:hypothetical protein AMAG_04309 [Allomyces macrogynus ATCC 38327]|uniref:SprT-like domain-containing protein n=1 Tax=Allomyces macrogynus (strain ATCC 38327) TaxID=578462 RepID=A0A0L0S8M7_ALLM3|nr:hypothetical protein AMAG_04309 [Allomyces macrogynus ATCC 38327]|eukprot:KNE58755.1 hypothetical protein AMAG_04309 [Allomyces macrogynus ATCC 38327]